MTTYDMITNIQGDLETAIKVEGFPTANTLSLCVALSYYMDDEEYGKWEEEVLLGQLLTEDQHKKLTAYVLGVTHVCNQLEETMKQKGL